MPRPASTPARRHDSNLPHLPPSYEDHDKLVKRPDNPPPTSSHPAVPPTDLTVHSSLLQPRVAVALGLSAKWHPLLFVCRLLSILPALWWGVPITLRLLVQLIVLLGNTSATCTSSHDDKAAAQSIPWLRDYGRIAPDLGAGLDTIDFETRLRMTEMALGIIWCASSAYLSFTFTDCLMSRWLLLYTPQATIVRLLAISATNLYLTSQTIRLTGYSSPSSSSGGAATNDPRLFLPAWITIATTLTGLYHVTQRKINIRKETRLSISVFSIASFISMVALLVSLQTGRPDWPRVPILEGVKKVWEQVVRVRLKMRELGDRGGGEL